MKMRSPTAFERCTRIGSGHLRFSSAQLRPICSALMLGAISFSLPFNCSPKSFSISFGSMSRSAERDDVLEQLALARIAVFLVGHLGERHADHGDVLAQPGGGNRLRRIVEQ